MKRVLLCTFAAAVLLPSFGSAATAATAHRAILIRHLGRGNATSTNWSGYATKGGDTFTDVKGNWIQPTAHCGSRGAKYSSFWVGIDGYTSNSVEQLGTEADCAGKNQPRYYAWWEMFPAGSNQISNFPVRPGDSISAEVSVSGSNYTLYIKNNTTGQTFSTVQSGSGLANANAEWIAEAPSLCVAVCQVQKLTNFGTVNFSGSYTTGNGHTGSISDTAWTNDKITMTTNGGVVKAQPSALSTDGTSFSVTWKHV